MNSLEIKRAKSLFYNKKSLPDFGYFTEKGVDYFVEWFQTLPKKCIYCGTEEYKLRDLFKSRLSTKRTRGPSLELERIDSSSNQYTEDNCGLACYFCNNHKSDIITQAEHKKYFAPSIKKYIDDLYSQLFNVSDSETNVLYLSGLLKSKYPSFADSFIKVLTKEKIDFTFMPDTKDVWAVDYMPIQLAKDKFLQFNYMPDYLRDTKKWTATITDGKHVCDLLNIPSEKSEIIIDGGNVVRCKSKTIMTSKVFIENPKYNPNELITELERLLNTSIIIIPTDPHDWIGHADGVVRFLNEDTVLINAPTVNTKKYHVETLMSLRNAGLNTIEIPFAEPKGDDAIGLYINYLQMNNHLFVPVFDLEEDEIAIKVFKKLFPNHKVIPILSNELAKDGGVLNCISWNIKK